MWYCVVIAKKGTHKPSNEILWEDSFRLIEAESDPIAAEIATRLSKGDETSFTTVSGDFVTWEFDRVLDIQEVLCDELFSGLEVYSQFQDESD